MAVPLVGQEMEIFLKNWTKMADGKKIKLGVARKKSLLFIYLFNAEHNTISFECTDDVSLRESCHTYE